VIDWPAGSVCSEEQLTDLIMTPANSFPKIYVFILLAVFILIGIKAIQKLSIMHKKGATPFSVYPDVCPMKQYIEVDICIDENKELLGREFPSQKYCLVL